MTPIHLEIFQGLESLMLFLSLARIVLTEPPILVVQYISQQNVLDIPKIIRIPHAFILQAHNISRTPFQNPGSAPVHIPSLVTLSHKKAKTNTHEVPADPAALHNLNLTISCLCIPLERSASILSCLQ